MYLKIVALILFSTLCLVGGSGSLHAGVLRVELKNLQQDALSVSFDIEATLLVDTFEFVDSVTLLTTTNPIFANSRFSSNAASGWDVFYDPGNGLLDFTAVPGVFPDPAPARLVYNTPQVIGTLSIDTVGLAGGVYSVSFTPDSAFGSIGGNPEIIGSNDIEIVGGDSFTIVSTVPEPGTIRVFLGLLGAMVFGVRRRRVVG